jgi:DNA-binding CsgD family transcriptional regulator
VASTTARDGEPSNLADGPRLVAELAAAEAARLNGRDDASIWASIGDRLERLGDLPRSALARQRQAEACLRERGERSEAVTAMRAVLGHAETMQAIRLRYGMLAVARAARLELARESRSAEPRPPEAADRWGLSRREREVLAMLVAGRTNRQIGDALYISGKTASVHVTHIMDKLGVSSRTEAALMAMRAGIEADAGTDLSISPAVGRVPPAS